VADSLYVFGGLSATSTSYNDLWQFDLGRKTWSRPYSTGSFPSPKAAATLVAHGTSLVLFGGYSHPYSYLHQQVAFFDELHTFCTLTCRWSQVPFLNEPEPVPRLAGHTASMLGASKMLLFGGCDGSLGNKTNAVYCLDVATFKWDRFGAAHSLSRDVDGPKPECRYGHSQETLDEERVLVVGGCGGPNKQFDDVWILHWPKDSRKNARWQQVVVKDTVNSPAQIYCISFVRYENKLVTFGKPRQPREPSGGASSRPVVANAFVSGLVGDGDAEVFTIAGGLKQMTPRKCSCSKTDALPLASNTVQLLRESQRQVGQVPLVSTGEQNTMRRLEALNRMACRVLPSAGLQRQLSSTASLTRSRSRCVVHSKKMQMFVMDLGELFAGETGRVAWQTPIVEFEGAPADTILYTLNKGVDEIILFGGMEMEAPSIQKSCENVKQRVSSRLYIMKPDSLFVSRA